MDASANPMKVAEVARLPLPSSDRIRTFSKWRRSRSVSFSTRERNNPQPERNYFSEGAGWGLRIARGYCVQYKGGRQGRAILPPPRFDRSTLRVVPPRFGPHPGRERRGHGAPRAWMAPGEVQTDQAVFRPAAADVRQHAGNVRPEARKDDQFTIAGFPLSQRRGSATGFTQPWASSSKRTWRK
jgi:hypothetical protein